MSDPNQGIRAAGFHSSRGALRAMLAPTLMRFARVLGVPGTFRFLVNDLTADDGWSAIRPSDGGGAWLRIAEDDRGDDLTGTGTIDVTGGIWRVITALSGSATITHGTTNAQPGDDLFVTRLDTSAYVATLVNGGPDAGTLATFPVSSKAWAWSKFDGADWVPRASGLLL